MCESSRARPDDMSVSAGDAASHTTNDNDITGGAGYCSLYVLTAAAAAAVYAASVLFFRAYEISKPFLWAFFEAHFSISDSEDPEKNGGKSRKYELLEK